jgi:hypothetical protein
MVSCCSVRIDSNPCGVDMDDCLRQVRDVVEELVVGDLCDLMCSRDGQGTILDVYDERSRPARIAGSATRWRGAWRRLTSQDKKQLSFE